MHAQPLRIAQIPAQRLRFGQCQLLQPLHRGLAAEALFAEQPVEAEMARFAGQQLAIQRPQLGIGAMGRQQGHALMAAGLNQASHQKRIEHALGVALAHLGREGRAVGRCRQGAQGCAAPLQQLQHLLEVLQLLPCQRAKGGRQANLAWITEHQLQGYAGGLALAVGVVNQQQLWLGNRLLQPGGAGGGRQPLHPGHQGWARRWATRPSRARV